MEAVTNITMVELRRFYECFRPTLPTNDVRKRFVKSRFLYMSRFIYALALAPTVALFHCACVPTAPRVMHEDKQTVAIGANQTQYNTLVGELILMIRLP